MKLNKKTVFLIVGGLMILIAYFQLRTPHYRKDEGWMLALLLAGIVLTLFGTKRGLAGFVQDRFEGWGKTLPEQIRSVEFNGTTSVERDGLIAAATETAGQVSETFGKIRVEDIQADGMRLSIKGIGGIVTQMSFTISWETGNDGRSRVDISVGQYLTSRPTIYWVIPIGRKRIVALSAMHRFRDGFIDKLGAFHARPGSSPMASGHTAWDLLQEPKVDAREDANRPLPPPPDHAPSVHRTPVDSTPRATPYLSTEPSLSVAKLDSYMYSLKAEAANPATSAARLDQLARQVPFTREDILNNPSSGPGLLSLIAQLNGTREVDEPHIKEEHVGFLPDVPATDHKSRTRLPAALWVVPLAAVAIIAALIGVNALAAGSGDPSRAAAANDTPGQQNGIPVVPATQQGYSPEASAPPTLNTYGDTSPSQAATLQAPPQVIPSPSPTLVSRGDLGLSNPIRQPACDGKYVVIYHSAIDPGAYAQEIQTSLDLHPGSNYLTTQGSCRSFNQISKNGTMIYAVYGGPFTSLDSACTAAVRFPDAYVKKLDNITAPDQAIQSCG